MQYDHKKIEKKWQDFWSKNKIYTTLDSVPGKENFYLLIEFPYPSGNLHVGHWYAFAVPDILARFHRMQGKNVLYPIGFDAFGLPAENAAIKNGVNPRVWTDGNIAHMKKQIESMGTSFDWSRELATYSPEYYKWTQWLFLQLYQKGLVYQKETAVNWCPNDKTVLANEQVVDGKCERCGHEVEQRQMLQWNIKITDYADRLIDDLDPLDWPQEIKESQKNWIGRSEGAEIDFRLSIPGDTMKHVVLLHGKGGKPDGDFMQWARTELEKNGYTVEIPALPNTNEPDDVEQAEYIKQNCTIDENTIIVGHSAGGLAAMRLLETSKAGRLVLVATPFSATFLDGKTRPSVAKSIDRGYDYEKIRSNVSAVLAVYDEGDPIIPLSDGEKYAQLLKGMFIKAKGNKGHFNGEKEPDVLMAIMPTTRVFTTRPDTLFGATYLVLAPEHPWVTLALGHKTVLENNDEVAAYVDRTHKMSDMDRQTSKEKTGARLVGVSAINPATGEKIPMFIADYVLPQYGTGAIMAVPAHDERDYEFAKKFSIAVREVVEPLKVQSSGPDAVRAGQDFVERDTVIAIVKHWSENKYLCVRWTTLDWKGFISGGIEEGENATTAGIREIQEESGYKNIAFDRIIAGRSHAKFFHLLSERNRFTHLTAVAYNLIDGETIEVSEKEKELHDFQWLDENQVDSYINTEDVRVIWHRYLGEVCFTGEGLLANSGEYNGLSSQDARKLFTEKFGSKKTTFRLRDWIVSRQRYWGVPIPMIHCEKCGSVPVPDAQLPVILPEVEDYLPEGTGKSPLAKVDSFVNTVCPKCGGSAKRETDTFDTFVDSSWYFLRYTDPQNATEFASRASQDAWMPVDLYSGGAEHTTMHLLYSRFWHKALYDIGLVKDPEPYKRRMNRSLIMGPDGQKMSKSRGNVIDPDEVVNLLGADTVRMYMAFMGPYGEVSSYPWNPDGVVGVRRFLERMARNEEYLQDADVAGLNGPLHKALKKIGEDIAVMKFNTAVSQLMILQNAIEKEKKVGKSQLAVMVRMLSPFAPHLAEELWHLLGNESSVHAQAWPAFDAKYLIDEEVTVAVQIDGKTRGEFTIASDADKAAMEAAAKEAVTARLEGKTIARTIVVPKRLVNFVLEA
jgi:leucyl-tRNA synthetase